MAERESAKPPPGYYNTTDAGKKYGKDRETGCRDSSTVLVVAMALPVIIMLLISLIKCAGGG